MSLYLSHLTGKSALTWWCCVPSAALRSPWLQWGLMTDLLLAAVGAGGCSSVGTCVPIFLFLFADCSQPLDVVLLLDGSSSLPESSFDAMKSFAKAFISKANIGE